MIVPAYDRADLLESCLASLVRQAYPPRCFQIFVVDNGSPTPLRELLGGSFPDVTWLDEPVVGPAAARNRALESARGDVIAFLDADCVAEPDWLANGVTFLAGHPAADLAAGRVEITLRDPARPTLVELYDKVFYLRQDRYVKLYRTAATANLFVRRRVFERAGRFDENLLSGHDWEFCLRAGAAGFGIAYVPTASVRHPARSTWKQFVSVLRRHAAGRRLLLGKVRLSDPRPFTRRAADWWKTLVTDSGLSVPQAAGVGTLDLLRRILQTLEGLRLALRGGVRADGGFARRKGPLP